jgi:general secretion pathway protein J
MKKCMKKTGFTLLEIMVAVVIGALVLLTAVSALRVMTQSRDKINVNIDAAAQISFAANLIDQDLANLYRDSRPENVRLVGGVEHNAEGLSSRLKILAVNRVKARPKEPEGEVYEVEYNVISRDGKRLLTRRLLPNPAQRESPGGILTVLAENVVNFDLRFFNGQDWQYEWPPDMKQLPDLIDVTLAAKLPRQKEAVKTSFMVNFSHWPQTRENPPEKPSENPDANQAAGKI